MILQNRTVQIAHEVVADRQEAQRDGMPRVRLEHLLVSLHGFGQTPEGWHVSAARSCQGRTQRHVPQLAIARPHVDVRRLPGRVRALRHIRHIKRLLKVLRGFLVATRVSVAPPLIFFGGSRTSASDTPGRPTR